MVRCRIVLPLHHFFNYSFCNRIVCFGFAILGHAFAFVFHDRSLPLILVMVVVWGFSDDSEVKIVRLYFLLQIWPLVVPQSIRTIPPVAVSCV